MKSMRGKIDIESVVHIPSGISIRPTNSFNSNAILKKTVKQSVIFDDNKTPPLTDSSNMYTQCSYSDTISTENEIKTPVYKMTSEFFLLLNK